MTPFLRTWRALGGRKRILAAPLLVTLTVLAVVVGLGGCAANDPFDPNSVPNRPPSIRFYVGPVDTSGGLNPTSYFNRTFNWSGTDPDGYVVEYFVSIDTSSIFPALWDTTTSTDTTMTFATDNQGNASATFLVACRDDRGAFSDTLVQFVPLRNFAPEVNFAPNFDPRDNMQREFIDADGNVTPDGAAAVDTNYYNWGPATFDLVVRDLDGTETLNEFYRYTMADTDPDSTYDQDDPRADPETSWVRVPFTGAGDSKPIFIAVKDVLPGPSRTLTVSVKDEADADALFQYSWEVRAPKGRVLYFPDVSSSITKKFYGDFLDAEYGQGNWDTYSFWFGLGGDISFTLLETMRKFDVIIWTDSGTHSQNIINATDRDKGAVLQNYLIPTDGAAPGKMVLVSRILVGSQTKLKGPFLQNVLGVNPSGVPPQALNFTVGNTALGLRPELPTMTAAKTATAAGNGLALSQNIPAEFIYQMEECLRCYGARPPFDPYVGVRSPARTAETPLATIVGLSIQLDDFDRDEAFAALAAILDIELGVAGP